MAHIAIFKNLNAYEIERAGGSWIAVVAVLDNEPEHVSKHDCRLFNFATFGERKTKLGSLRSNDNIVEIHGLVGDHDDGSMSIDQAVDALERCGVMGAVYPSASHTVDHPRWRVVVPLARPVSVAEHTALMNRLNGVLSGVLAGESWTASQSYFFGPVAGKPYAVRVAFDDAFEGTCLDDLDELDALALGKQSLGRNAPTGLQAVSAAKEAAGRLLREGDGRREFLKSMIASASGAGLSFQDIRAQCEAAISTNFDPDDPVDWSNVEGMIRHFVRRDVGKGPDLDAFDLVTEADAPQRPPYRHVTGKGRYQGYKVTNVEQLLLCIESDPTFPWRVSHDAFFQERMIYDKQTGVFERLQDHHYTLARVWWDSDHWEPVSAMMAREVIHLAAMKAQTNVGASWLESHQWDGTDRMPDFLIAFGINPGEYELAVARYWWTGLAGRLLEPGCQADSIIVLIGGQGLGKTRGLNAVAPDICGQRTSREITINELLSPESSARVMRATIVANMDEMRSVSKKEASDVKSALSRSVESYIPKYLESRATFGRVGLIFGTGNEYEILDDSTGHRRYLMLEVKNRVDIEWLNRMREQLWAQGAAEFRSSGVAWERAAELSPEVAKGYEVTDVWFDSVKNFADKMNNSDLTASQILEHGVGVSTDKMTQTMKIRVGKIMTQLGWRQTVTKDKDRRSVKVWRPHQEW
jgi:hypothetical protein